MNVTRGYRLPLTGAQTLGDCLAGLRADSLRVFTRRYGAVLADEVARRVDLHRAGVDVRDADLSPVKEAVEHLRGLFAMRGRRPAAVNLNFRVRVHLVEDQALFLVEEGHDDYVSALSGLPGVRAAQYAAGAEPEGCPPEEWAERARLWDLAFAGPSLASGLQFRLIEGTLPSLRFASLRRFFPEHGARCRRTARALVFKAHSGGKAVPGSAEEAREFKRYLESPKGKSAFDQAVRRLARALPPSLEREDVARYAVVAAPARPAPQAPQADPPRQIDHADVIEAGDGRVFVAVMEAGLSTEDRIHIQVVDRHLSFVQNGIHFGGVAEAPHKAVDLLRETREAIVVEIRRVGDKREIKARHVALVRDDTLGGSYGTAMATFRSAAARARSRETAQWLEN